MKIIYSNNEKDLSRQKVVKSLINYNESTGPAENREWMAFYAEDDNGELLGGIHGYFEWDYLFIKHLWVAKQGKGSGTRLLAAAEQLAHKKNRKGVWLDTFKFQAAKFYEKQGYKLFGEIQGAAGNYSRYFFIKTF